MRFVFTGIWIVFSFALMAQDFSRPEQGVRSIYGTEISQKLSKKWSVGVKQDIRVNHIAPSRIQYLIEPGATFKITKDLRASASYRMSFFNNAYMRHRIYLKLRYKADFGEWELTPGISMQKDWQYLETNGVVFRQKLKLAYNRKKFDLTPFAFAEVFSLVESSFAGVNGLRIGGGAEYKVSKRVEVGVEYFWQSDFLSEIPSRTHTLGVSFGYSLPKLKKKKVFTGTPVR